MPNPVLAACALSLMLLAPLTGAAQAAVQPSPARDKALVAFVDKAAAWYAAKAVDAASEKAVLAAFSDPKGAWIEGELYLYAYDRAGVCLAHGYRAELVGRNLIDLRDSDGIFMVKLILEGLAKGDRFWQQFRFPNPVKDNKVAPKRSYNRLVVTKYRPQGIMIGSGYYQD